MRRFLLYTCSFLVAAVLFFCCIEYFLSKTLADGKRFYFQADWHDLSNHNADMLFIGNSRTWVQYDPFLIEQKTGLKTEAIAQDGQGPQVVWLKFREYAKKNKLPQKMFLQFDYWFVHQRQDLFGIKNFQTGFFLDRLDLREMRNLEGYSVFYHYLPLAAIDVDVIYKWITGYRLPAEETYEKTHGFIPQNKAWSGDWQKPDPIRDTASPSKYVDSFFVFAKQNKISLFLIYPPQSYPSYREYPGMKNLQTYALFLANKYRIDAPFLNFNDSTRYNDSTLFYNHMHLNKKGVQEYMNQLFEHPELFKN